MSPAVTLAQLGGLATTADLRRWHTRRELAVAVSAGSIVRTGRGRYALAAVTGHRVVAQRHTAVVSHLSAAVVHGWAVKTPPELAWLTVPPGRRLVDGVHLRRGTVSDRERRAGVTSPLRTVADCARVLAFDEALAVADSALRSGRVHRGPLREYDATLAGPGSGAVRRVAQETNALAANPFESVLRAIAIEAGLTLEPQLAIHEPGVHVRVDLGDRSQRLALEADGFEHHGTRGGFSKDRRRATLLGVHGWTYLPFTWVDVMVNPAWVRWALETWLAGREGRPPPAPLRDPFARPRTRP